MQNAPPTIILFDCAGYGDDHLWFNASVLRAWIDHSDYHIRFVAQAEHVELIRGLLGSVDNRIVFEGYNWQRKRTRVGTALSFWKRYRQVRTVIKRHRPDRIFVLSFEYSVFPVALLVHARAFREAACSGIFHVLRSVRDNPAKRRWWKWALQRTAFQPVVLTQVCQQIMQSSLPGQRVAYWPHPTYAHFMPDPIAPAPVLNHEARLLFVGRQAINAGNSGLLRELAELGLRDDTGTGRKLEIYAYHPDLRADAFQHLPNVHVFSHRLSSEQFEQAMQDCHYVGFVDMDDLELRASGVLADALTRRKPILCPDKGHFAELKQGAGKRYGWLYMRRDDLPEIVTEMLGTDAAAYQQLCANMADLERQLSLEKQGPALIRLVEGAT